MTTRNWVLIGLGVTVAAGIVSLFTTERGKKVKDSMSDTLADWTKQLKKFTESDGDGMALAKNAGKSNAARHLKHLP